MLLMLQHNSHFYPKMRIMLESSESTPESSESTQESSESTRSRRSRKDFPELDSVAVFKSRNRQPETLSNFFLQNV